MNAQPAFVVNDRANESEPPNFADKLSANIEQRAIGKFIRLAVDL